MAPCLHELSGKIRDYGRSVLSPSVVSGACGFMGSSTYLGNCCTCIFASMPYIVWSTHVKALVDLTISRIIFNCRIPRLGKWLFLWTLLTITSESKF